MKPKNYLAAAGLVAALSWGSAGTQAQVYERQHQGRTPPVRQTERPREIDRRYEGEYRDYRDERRYQDSGDHRDGRENRERPVARRSNVTPANQASNLIGMEVRNHRNEKLGEIKDLAVDLQSGQISYAVLGVGGFLGFQEKLLAVPPHAFGPGRDHRTLILNADKAAVDQARGFPSTNWPDVGQPAWGGDVFWENPEDAGRRDLDRRGTRELEGRLDRDRQYRDRELERESEVETRRAPRVQERPRALEGEERYRDRDTQMFRGTIESIDAANRIIELKRGGETFRFRLSDNARVTIQERLGDLRQLQQGDEVVIRFREDARGNLEAVGVTLTDHDRDR